LEDICALFKSDDIAIFASFVSAFVSTDQEVDGATFGSEVDKVSSTDE
jgi:hypothetical protein